MSNCLSRCAFLGLCCGIALAAGRDAAVLPPSDARFTVTVARPLEKPSVRDKAVFRFAAHLASSEISSTTLVAELRDARDVEKSDIALVAAIGQLERQVREVTSPSLRALFAERARALLVLTSYVQVMRGRHTAALMLSDRARRVVNRTFGSAPAEIAGDMERAGQNLVGRVPAGVTTVHQEIHADQLLTWVIRDGEVYFLTASSAATIVAEVERFQSNSSVVQAQRLYDILMRPLSRYTTGSQLLVYSPAPELQGVPFAVLHDGDSFLIERQPIVVTSSISLFLERLGRGGATQRGAALITLPAAGPGSVPLPGARHEASVVATIYGSRATSLLDADATSTTFMSMAPQFDIIHVGTHGRADAQPLQSAIEFGSDRVRAAEIMRLRLTRKPVVILAGCRTGDETEGRTTISLSSAFVAAGASAVVGSLWDVEDQSTARLMVDFHQHLSRGMPASEALALAQKSAIARSEQVSGWAAFQVQM